MRGTEIAGPVVGVVKVPGLEWGDACVASGAVGLTLGDDGEPSPTKQLMGLVVATLLTCAAHSFFDLGVHHAAGAFAKLVAPRLGADLHSVPVVRDVRPHRDGV